MKKVDIEDKSIMRTHFVDKLSVNELKKLIAEFFGCKKKDVDIEGISYFGYSLIVLHTAHLLILTVMRTVEMKKLKFLLSLMTIALVI